MLRIIFAGTPQLACYSLEQLFKKQLCKKSAAFEVVGVLTQTDQMVGRKRSLQPSAVKAKALELGISAIFAPAKLDADLRKQIAELKPDLLAVFAYGKIFRQNFLELFSLGGINLHPSALPQWRGPSPIEAQLRAGNSELGITVQRISLAMDAGDVLLQEQFPLPALADYYQAAEIASREGAKMLGQACAQIAARGQEFLQQARSQDQSKASYCKLIQKQDGLIHWHESAAQIARNCRAYAAWPKIYTKFPHLENPQNPQNPQNPEETVQILSAREWQGSPEELQQIKRLQASPGTLLALHLKAELLILCGEGVLAVQALQRQNRKVVSAQEFANQLRSSSAPAVLPKSLPEAPGTFFTFI